MDRVVAGLGHAHGALGLCGLRPGHCAVLGLQRAARAPEKQRLVGQRGLRPELRRLGLADRHGRVRELQRRLIGFAVDTEMDSAGRVLISPALRQYAQLEKDVVLVGQGRKFELWHEENWNELIARAGGFSAGGLPPELEGFSL